MVSGLCWPKMINPKLTVIITHNVTKKFLVLIWGTPSQVSKTNDHNNTTIEELL